MSHRFARSAAVLDGKTLFLEVKGGLRAAIVSCKRKLSIF